MSVAVARVRDGAGGSRPFDAAALESDLKNMWRTAEAGDVSRAALANLVVPLDPALGLKLTPVLVEVTRCHPARLFSIGAGTGPGGSRLTARLGAICHRRESGGGLVCSEQVVLESDADSTALIPSAVRSLLIGDLPTVLLDFHAVLDLPWIAELADMADLILMDSCLYAPGTEPLVWRFLRDQGSRRVHDLAWARLVSWRAILAEVFDGKEYLPALGAIRSVEIGFTGAGFPPPPAWLLAGWLASRLGWTPEGMDPEGLLLRSKRGAVTVALRGTGSGERRAVESVRIRSVTPHPLDVEIAHEGKDATARVTLREPRAASSVVPFGYREFAACIVGEIHRHSANRPLEDAALAAEELMRHWRGA